MSSSSMSSASVSNPSQSTPLCFCEVEATLKYSNTRRNPGRAFLGCRKYNTEGLPYCKFFKWANSQDIEQDLFKLKKELLRKEADLVKMLKEIEKREIELQKKADEIEKKEILLASINEEIMKKEWMLLQQEAEIKRSRTLFRLFLALVVIFIFYIIVSK
ncbi:hypothetical protein I3843_09G000900 [Carya illinoinensis]|uniref:GRF-type domain-containing protein n=1 Tax=Carya illinoinensis TaxID=32201 RepID=A0A8T1PEC3_CARIL|nr:uncharacterized protein LOC122276427 [Carya illinoinensis]KAG6640398.1 hypothetical protein CIPAW_09G001000 [Carya illinoinensis]KAG7961123.1 hypothetical protein I3843_09G000900 [Carya illinoinensis]